MSGQHRTEPELDQHNRRLSDLVRPSGHRNPTPAPKYDLVVIGGGTAGLVCAAGAAGLGARVALVERSRLGGDCLNTGCVPSKAMLRSARVAAESHRGSSLGVPSSSHVDFTAVMARLRARRADLAPADSAERFTSIGVDVFFGSASFSSERSVSVASDRETARRELRFRKAVIATGSRPLVPDVPGLSSSPFLTNESVFELTTQPRELVVIGGGAGGCELAQAFARLGTRVTLLEGGSHVLPREDREAAALVEDSLRADGVDVQTKRDVTSVRWVDERFVVERGAATTSAEALLVAAGRAANVEDLGLDAAGVAYTRDGVTVDDRLRTSNSRIFAAGDVCSRYKFTHAADAMARIVVRNALFFGRARVSSLVIPWCTFTSPEVARVGEAGDEAAANGAEAITIPLSSVDRAVVDDATDGFVRVHHRKGRVVGATVVAPDAGDLIGAIALVMRYGGTLADLSSVVFPYPTIAIALRQAGNAYRRSAVTPRVKSALRYYFRVFR